VCPSHSQVRALLLDAERWLSQRFETDFRRELSLVDDASALLALMVGAVPVSGPSVEIDLNAAGIPAAVDVPVVQTHALKFIGLRTVRVVRAARSALATGYEPEARSYDRILLELADHVDGVLSDPSGKTALDWWKGKRRHEIGARLAASGARELHRSLSEDSHGDPAPAIRLIDDANTLELGPRRTAETRRVLLGHAAACRNHAVAIAGVANITVTNLAEFDERIFAMWVELADDKETASCPTKDGRYERDSNPG
jgi:hypothetical protein